MQLLKKQLCLNAVRGRDNLVWDHLTRGLLGDYPKSYDGAWPSDPEHEEGKTGAVYLLSKHKLAEIIYGSPRACCSFARRFAGTTVCVCVCVCVYYYPQSTKVRAKSCQIMTNYDKL